MPISDIADQTTDEDVTLSVAFSINDAETAPGALTLGAASSNTNLVALTNIVFSGAGAARMVTLTLDSDPPGAEVIQEHDGMRIGKTPFHKTLAPVSGGTLVYVLRLDGHDDYRVSLAADVDNREKVALKPRAKKPPTGRPRPPGTTVPPLAPPSVPTGPTPDGMLRPKT